MVAGARLDLVDADVRYRPEFFGPETAARLLCAIRDEAAWEEKFITIFGRTMPSPRLTAWHGDPGAVYRYSGLELHPRPWTAGLTEVRRAVETELGLRFDAVLCNLYRDGADSMGWHADDERELGPRPVIASVSLGAPRRFLLRHRTDRQLRHGMNLEPGSLLVMQGETQRHWQHAVPKTRRAVAPRINLTFRRLPATAHANDRAAK